VRTPSAAHDAFCKCRTCGIKRIESGWQILAPTFYLSWAQLLHLPSLLFSALLPSQTLATDRCDGVQPPMLPPLNGGQPQEAEADDQMAVGGV
jgi:hypothetical protein